MQINALLTAAPAAAGTASGSLLSTVITIGLVFVVFYFFIIRPQNKEKKETEKMISALKKGDKIVTIGGIHGTVSSTKEQTVIIKVDDGARIEFSRSAIAKVIVDKVEKEDKVEKKTDKKIEQNKEEVEEKKEVEEKTSEEK